MPAASNIVAWINNVCRLSKNITVGLLDFFFLFFFNEATAELVLDYIFIELVPQMLESGKYRSRSLFSNIHFDRQSPIKI